MITRNVYVCENWPLTLREEHRLREFDNRVLRKICRPKIGRSNGGIEKIAQ
jgi:hypothetical protein